MPGALDTIISIVIVLLVLSLIVQSIQSVIKVLSKETFLVQASLRNILEGAEYDLAS